ncbi:Uncharacterised protein [Bordetella ansorpii]|jgi:hypothetical protein|uniref:Uncharacterized protein n=1 Tax=Bordetella ansorpii TaxID=288768 RepID=A0A157PUT4_9BORD|nr:type III secretion system chaperone [Bordetella ansorpii]SAI37415.1 Uncharacterised protein [Bordetella ansorpii]
MPQFDDPAFQRLAASLGEVTPTSPRSFDLVFDDNLCVTVSRHPRRPEVCVDVWCHDVSAYVGAPRRALVDTLLLLNRTAQAGQPFRVGLDSRDFIVVHASQAMDRLEGGTFGAWLTWMLDQGRRVRELVRAIGFENGRLTYELAAAPAAALAAAPTGDE